MTAPQNRDEYLKRFMENQRLTGFGAGVKTHFPCPFCAAPEWLVMPVTDGLNDYPIMGAGAACKECGRSAKFIINRTPSSVSAECVQTGGDDPPAWLEPKIRRVEG